MRRDHGWIHALLAEAENERMHLLISLEIRKPGPFFRAAVIGTQAAFLHLLLPHLATEEREARLEKRWAACVCHHLYW